MFKKFKSLFSGIGSRISSGFKSFTESFEEDVYFNPDTGKVEFKTKGFKQLVTRTLYRRAVYKARKYQRAENALIKKHQHKITTTVNVGGKKHKNTLTLGEWVPSKLPTSKDVAKVKLKYKPDYWEARDKIYRDNFIKAIEYASSMYNVDLSHIIKMIEDMRISEFKAMMYSPGNQFVIFHTWYEGSIEQIDYMVNELENVIGKYSASGRYRKPDWGLSDVEKGSRKISEHNKQINVIDKPHHWFDFRTYRNKSTPMSIYKKTAENMSRAEGGNSLTSKILREETKRMKKK